jgi:hypothetical protein
MDGLSRTKTRRIASVEASVEIQRKIDACVGRGLCEKLGMDVRDH